MERVHRPRQKSSALSLLLTVGVILLGTASVFGVTADQLSSKEYPDLFKFKLFGGKSIYINERASLVEPNGYTGTRGGWGIQNDSTVVLGPVLVGGKLQVWNDTYGSATENTAHVVLGSMEPLTNNSKTSVYGPLCLMNSKIGIAGEVDTLGGTICSKGDSTKFALLPWINVPVVDGAGTWVTNATSTDYELVGQKHTINGCPADIKANKFKNIYLTSLSMSSGDQLRINQCKGGYTRIFANTMSFNNTEVELYMDGVKIDPADYQGTLMFYAPSISFSNRNNLIGSFVTTGSTNMPSAQKLSGQLLVDGDLAIQSGFSAGNFVYLPFDPPLVNITPTASAGGNFIEDGKGGVAQIIPVMLSSKSVVNAQMSYEVLAYAGTGKDSAEVEDFVPGEGIGKTGVLEIAEGDTTAGNVSLTLVDDTIPERSPEYFTLKLCAVESVALPNPDANGCQSFDLTIAPSDPNHAPVIADQNLSIAENQAAKLIHTFTANDTLDVYENGQVKPARTYRIVNIKSTGKKFPFNLTPAGVLTSTETLDFEDTTNFLHSYTFGVEVNDNSVVPNPSLKDTAVVTLTLTDTNDAPTALALSANSVVENAAAKTFVGKLSGFDQDTMAFPDRKTTQTFTHSLPQAADQSEFLISNDSLYTKLPLDFETQVSYSIKIMVTDSKGASYTEDFTIVVRDTNDAPTAITLSKDSVSENLKINTLVGTLGAIDQDAMDVFSFSLVSGTGDTDNASYQISNDSLYTKAKFDYETKKTYSIRVRVTDKGGLTKDSVFSIKIHDEEEAPYFDQDTLSVNVPENDTAVATIKAKDLWNAPLTYSVSDGADKALFSVNPSSGALVFVAAPDFENPQDAGKDNVYELKVRASNGPFSAEQVVIVTVTDVQEIGSLPSTATKSIAENTSAVLKVSVTDLDAKQGKVYKISGGADASLFSIDATGALSFDAAPDYEKPSDQGKDNIYVVVVSVKDTFEPGFAALQQTITVTVTNVDEKPSAIAHEYTTPEEVALTVAAPGILLGATDPEGAALRDSLVLSPAHGELKLLSDGSFTYTPVKDYFGTDTFTYVVLDPAGNASEPSTVTIVVTGVNEAPELAPAVYSIDENAPAGTVVGQLEGTDVDKDRLTYALVSGSGFVVAANGQITLDTGMVLDYESSVKNYLIRVSVSDDSGMSAQADVEIVLKNVVETANVIVVSAQAGDSLWSYPDTVWVNRNTVDVSWAVEGSLRKDIDSVKTNAFTQLVKTASVPEKDLPGSDTLIVVMNEVAPVIDILLPPKRPTPVPGTTAVEPSDPTDPVVYINDKERDIAISVKVKDKQMQDALVLDTIRPELHEGLNDVTYTYTDIYGNTATKTVQVYMDLTAPVVVIHSPENLFKTSNVLQSVVWTVDGDTMDVLNLQSLQDGANTIVRTYRDKAGNEGSDTVIVFFDMGKGIELAMEKDLVTLNPETIEKYYASNPPAEDELYSISLLNNQTGKEEKVSYGKGAVSHTGDSSEPYAGLSGTHLGPTLVVRIRLPQMGGTDATGAARGGMISDLVENGMVALTSGTGSDRTMVPAGEYVSEHCLADAFDKGMSLDEMLASPQYQSTVSLKIHVFDVTGQFVDNMSITQEINSASYLDDAGVLTLFFELKPSREHGLEDITGRQYGTGAYLMNALVKAVSVRRCDTPDGAKGEKIKSSDQVLEKFGYMRASW